MVLPSIIFILVNIFVCVVAVLHLWFMVLEMFLWTKPLGLRTFGKTAAFAESTRTLAANQGLYNGFLAAGLIWSLYYPDGLAARHLQVFFLTCVAVAGIYGGKTVSRKIFVVQALPALIGLGFLLSILFSA